MSARAASSPAVRVLVADDDESQRILYGSLVLGLPGVTSVVAAQDGVEAVRVAGALALHVAILDLNMPRLDGVEAALRLSATQPSLRIALHSSDPDELRQRAHGLSPHLAKVLNKPLQLMVKEGLRRFCVKTFSRG